MKETLATLAYALMLIILYFGSIYIAQELGKTITKDDMSWCDIQMGDSKATIPCERVSRLD